MSEEIKYKRALTPRILVIAIISTVLIVILQMWMEAIANRTTVRAMFVGQLWPYGVLSSYTGGHTRGFLDAVMTYLFIPIGVSLLLPKKWRLTPQELAFVYAMIGPVPAIAGLWSGVGGQLVLNLVHLQLPGDFGKFAREYLPGILGPKSLVALKAMYKGGGVVPWNAWTVTLAYWIVLWISFFLFAVFGASIMRKPLVEIEALPFPTAQIVSGAISLVDSEQKQNPFRSKFMLLGILLGFVYTAFSLLNTCYYPGIFTGLSNEQIAALFFRYDITYSLSLMTATVLGVQFSIGYLGVGLILGRDVLFSSVLAYFVLYVIIPEILIAIGDYGTLVRRPCWAIWQNVYNRCWFGYPNSFTKMGYMPWITGMLLALGVTPILFHWRDILAYFKAAIGGSTEALTEEERSVNRISWFGWIGSGLVSIVMLVIAGIPVEWAVFLFAVLGLTWLGLARFCAETGMPLIGLCHSDGGLAWNPVHLTNAVMVYAGVRDPYVCAATGRIAFDILQGQHYRLTMDPMYWNLDSYRVGDQTKPRSRIKDLFTAQIIGIILSVCIALPFALWLWYTYGWAHGLAAWPQTMPLERGYQMSKGVLYGFTRAKTVNEWVYAWFIAAFVVTLGIYYMRGRVGGFWTWLSPAGFLMASIEDPTFYWLSFVIALIIKEIVIRVGGAPLYQRKVMPFAVGLLIGSMLHYIPAMLAYYLRGLGYRWWV